MPFNSNESRLVEPVKWGETNDMRWELLANSLTIPPPKAFGSLKTRVASLLGEIAQGKI